MTLPVPSAKHVAVVTGASSGIGAELARELSRRGHELVLVARTAEKLQSLADELGTTAHVVPADLGDPQGRAELVTELDSRGLTPQVLVNNAGFSTLGPVHRSDPQAELGLVEVDVAAVVDLCSRLLPGMVERGTGAVLNVASTAAFQPLPGFATYAASKAFVHSFSEAVHSELSGTGVSVTSLCPGFTKTEFEQAAGAEDAASKLPGFTWMESDDVARQAIEGMLAGRRTVVPGALNKAVSTSGRYIPRTVLLPLVKTVSKNS
jgi:short-subunit dehydrogenase